MLEEPKGTPYRKEKNETRHPTEKKRYKMEEQKLYYPIGIQDFADLRRNGYVYVDKTEVMYRLISSRMKFIFLSRPRRFGKSLLASTLHCYFAGQKELFRGLAIEKLEKEWTEYPVLHFDMSTLKSTSRDNLENELNLKLKAYEAVYGRDPDELLPNQRLLGLIVRAYRKTGKQVVVLIDEYDAPLLDVVHRTEELQEMRQIMRNFYSPLKACSGYLRFAFLTGITKFSQLSIFSELNNIANISMDKPYADICGLTETDIRTQLWTGVKQLAEETGVTAEQAMSQLKELYDGYHFTWPSPDIYNPYSVINALGRMELDDYWFDTATPTFLIEMMRKFRMSPSELGSEMRARREFFNAPTEDLKSMLPLLYQSGYLTIKGYRPDFKEYILKIPNKEVRIGLLETLLPVYVTPDSLLASSMTTSVCSALRKDDMDGALRLIQTFLSTVPYCDNTDYEGHYQQVLYIIFSLLGEFVDVEVRTPKGRVDMVLRTDTTLYLMELKLDKNAEEAMRQIDLKQYPERFALCGLPVVKVAVSFDRERHTLAGWKIEKADIHQGN